MNLDQLCENMGARSTERNTNHQIVWNRLKDS